MGSGRTQPSDAWARSSTSRSCRARPGAQAHDGAGPGTLARGHWRLRPPEPGVDTRPGRLGRTPPPTELELTRRETTADYGSCAVHRLPDLREFADRLAEIGCTTTLNFAVPMDTPEDRWVRLQAVEGEAAPPDIAHLRLAMGESVSTSFGLLIRRLP